ncbi:MAG: GNAT family N-acetyltransferase [Hydrogenophilaceae bacterium]|nr:GNAT family N-acetyltransferase [Hydrogenophilaceae bacterium]
MTEFSVRPLEANEIDSLCELAHEIWHAHYPGIIGKAQIDYMLAQRYSAENIRASLVRSCWLAAWHGQTMIGFAQAFADESPSIWKLDKLYVRPDHQRKGVGRALLGRVTQQAHNVGAARLILRVNKRNTIALAAYAKYGFRIYGQDVLDIGNGFVMDDYLLEMDLLP